MIQCLTLLLYFMKLKKSQNHPGKIMDDFENFFIAEPKTEKNKRQKIPPPKKNYNRKINKKKYNRKIKIHEFKNYNKIIK